MPVPRRRHAPARSAAAPIEPLESRQLLSAGFGPRPVRADFGHGAMDAPVSHRQPPDAHATFSPFHSHSVPAEPGRPDFLSTDENPHGETFVQSVSGYAQNRPEPAGQRPIPVGDGDGDGDVHVLVPTSYGFPREAAGPVFVLPALSRGIPIFMVEYVAIAPPPALVSQPTGSERQVQRADAPNAGPAITPARAVPTDVRPPSPLAVSNSAGPTAVAPVASATAAMARGALAAVVADTPVISGAVSAARAALSAAAAAQSVLPAAARLFLGATPFASTDAREADGTPAPASAGAHALAAAIEGAVTSAVSRDVHAVTHAGEVVVAGLQTAAVALPRTFFYFPRIDAVANFDDAMAAFIDDSAAPAASAHHSRSRAWIITAAVVAADVALLVYWHRSGKKKGVRAAAMPPPRRGIPSPA